MMIEFTIYVILAAFLFWPERGIVMRWQRGRRLRSRQAIEDALMHINQRQHEGRPGSIESLSSSMKLPPRYILELVNRMDQQGLLNVTGDGLSLSSDGHRWALQVVRAHRLFERYLADETAVPMEALHTTAHRLEHTVSVDQVNKMDADMGHPAYDPQGDPIPNESGEVEPLAGQSLVDWPVNEIALIVHIEDEPDEVYAQIIADGLEPGMLLTVIESTGTRIVCESERNEHVLAPVVAANITVQAAPSGISRRQGDRLSELGLGSKGRVVAIDAACRGLTRRRFLDLGITPGVTIESVLENAFNDPTAYRVRGAMIALRREQADMVWIENAERK
jgi:DtxR family transcriptional regulator, Mn-dependent transcriptional regulator